VSAPRPAWPHVLMLVADALGEPAALRLAERLGGQRRYVPEAAAGSRLAVEAGEDVAAVLADHYGGESIYIPRGPADGVALAEDVRTSNLSANALAGRHRRSVRTIHRLRRRIRGMRDPRQGDLL